MKANLIGVVVGVLCVLAVTGCPPISSVDDNPIATWKMMNAVSGVIPAAATWTSDFYADGTFHYVSIAGIPVDGTWERLSDGRYHMVVTSVTALSLEYYLTVDDGKTIENGETLTGEYLGGGTVVATFSGVRQ